MLNLFKATKTEQQIIQEIHNEFDTAEDRLLQAAKDIISYRNPLNNRKAERMAAIGFVNSEPVLKHLENKNVLVKNKEQASLIEYYKQTYPFQKFITEDELNRICKKYRLAYKPVENYAKDIPEKNLTEIEQAKERLWRDNPENIIWCELKRDNSFFLTSANGTWSGIWGSDWYRIPKRIDGKHFGSRYSADEYLRTEMGFGSHYLTKSVKNYTQDRQGLFICAPASHFKGHDKSIFMTEVKDPIVFRYCKGGIQVLSKWGLEASDEILVNEINN